MWISSYWVLLCCCCCLKFSWALFQDTVRWPENSWILWVYCEALVGWTGAAIRGGILVLLRIPPSDSDCWEHVLLLACGSPSGYASAPSVFPPLHAGFPPLHVGFPPGQARTVLRSFLCSYPPWCPPWEPPEPPWPAELPPPLPQHRETRNFCLGSSSSILFLYPGNSGQWTVGCDNLRAPSLVPVSENAVLCCLVPGSETTSSCNCPDFF